VKALEAAVDGLRPPSVQLAVKIGVLDRGRLLKVLDDGEESVRRLIPQPSPQASRGKLLISLEEEADVESVLAELEKAKALFIHSRPQMITLSGTTASCYVGQAVAAKGSAGGVGVVITPTLKGPSLLTMELHVQTKLSDDSTRINWGDDLGAKRLAASFDMQAGKAAVVTWVSAYGERAGNDRGASSTSASEGEQDLLIVIKPTRYEEPSKDPAPDPSATGQAERSWWERWRR
jgi:hypothetical protein